MEKKTDFKSLTKKAKAQYIWDYYRWPIVIIISVGATALSLINHYVNYQEPLLNVIMFNCNDTFTATADGFNEFFDAYGYDADAKRVSLSSSLLFPESEKDTGAANSNNDYQLLNAMLAVGDQDLFFGRGPVYVNYANQGIMADLSQILPAETLEKYKDNLVYATNNGEVEPYPCAIELTDNKWITENHYYTSCYFGIFVQSAENETVLDFAEFLLNYE